MTGGVTIGERTVVGANSVVTSDLPAGVIAAGAPAKVIREIEFRKSADSGRPALHQDQPLQAAAEVLRRSRRRARTPSDAARGAMPAWFSSITASRMGEAQFRWTCSQTALHRLAREALALPVGG